MTFCYNATEHSSTGFSPFFLFTGRQPLWHMDLLLVNDLNDDMTPGSYATEVTEGLDEVRKLHESTSKQLQIPPVGGIMQRAHRKSLR